MPTRNGASRAEEVETVSMDYRDRWLAAQIDEVEEHLLRKFTELKTSIDGLTSELSKTREEMHQNANKVIFSMLGAVVAALLALAATVITRGG